uniref:Uncharacterized protein n=2 Tax=Rhizophora mucronata TaxID=61149 RepID=A0A2P2JZ64_RHIMU
MMQIYLVQMVTNIHLMVNSWTKTYKMKLATMCFDLFDCDPLETLCYLPS